VVVVVVVVDAGILAMTAERMSALDTPRVACAQPVSNRRGAAAIAPTRGSEGVIMSGAKAGLAPVIARFARS
jgi:hypothetical protein